MKIAGFATIILSLLLLWSCKSAEEMTEVVLDEIGPEPEIVKGEVVKKLYSSNGEDSTEVKVTYEYFSKQFSSNVMDSIYKDSVNAIIYRDVMVQTFGEINGFAEDVSHYFFRSRLDSFAAVYEYEKDEYSYPWSLEESIWITGYKSFVKLSISNWSYTGGAHGNGYLMYYNVDRETGALLVQEDFFSDTEALNRIGEKIFREMHELTPEESLNEYGFWFDDDRFRLNDNFTFSGDNVIFYFNIYEIGPYAGGPTELVIPLKDIKHLMKRKL